MFMDRTTEMVAHMIGIFHITLEEERMREIYEKFKSLKAADPENDPLQFMGVTFKSHYVLEDFHPRLAYDIPPPTTPQGDIASPFYLGAIYPLNPLPSIPTTPDAATYYSQVFQWMGRPLLTLEPPSSVAVVSAQHNFLTDNDFLDIGVAPVLFTDTAVFDVEVQQFQTIAAAIAAPVRAEPIAPGETAAEDAIALHGQMGAAEAAPISGVTATMMHGGEVAGIHINGESAEEIPVLKDIMPSHFDEDIEDLEDEESDPEVITTADDDYDWPDPFEGVDPSDDDPFEGHDGHSIVMGANILVNEVVVSSAWIDAPIISVMGDAINLDVIAQINILSDLDEGLFTDASAFVAINAAGFQVTATTPDPEEGEEVESAPGEYTGLPANWAVTTIEGDLICYNQISQYSFVTDHDQANVTFENSGTLITMGQNVVSNLAALTEYGFGYDLILVGGNMISMNWITQTNILLDNDTVTFTGGAPGHMSGSDNLLFNSAAINSVGANHYEQMQSNFANATNDLAGGAATIDESVAHDPVFEGTEILTVLYVSGDLTTMNWINQTNVLGDVDQVHLALENLVGGGNAAVNVTTGSNATVNVATVNDFGTDSTIHVGGDIYDDALLYQAELIDTDADPLGVSMPALASEAVAFLADDMLSPEQDASDAPIMATTPESSSPDVMQTMLA